MLLTAAAYWRLQTPRPMWQSNHWARACAIGLARYSEQAGDSTPTKKIRPRFKYMVLKPTSPALTRMAAKIKEGEVAMDIAKEVDCFKFTTEDLIRALPMHRAQVLGGVDMAISSADLMLSSKEEMVSMLYDLRTKRVEAVVRAFNGAQLKQYLRQHQLRVSGTKKEMVNRILNDVWGISLKALETRFAMPKEAPNQDGLTMPLSDEALALLNTLEDGHLKRLEAEFGVKIAVDLQKREVRATGIMHHVRGALSTLRESLTANTTVQIELAKYGVIRALSKTHTQSIFLAINRATGGALSLNNGEFFVRGDSPIAALDAQRAVLHAMIEPKNQALFVVAPEVISDTPACTVVPAANPFSQPPTFVPDMSFYTNPGADFPTPISFLARHVLLERTADGSISRGNRNLVQALQSWATQQQCLVGQSVHLSAKLGKVVVDMDSMHKSLATQFHTPESLMTAIARRAPLFGFSSNVSPLKWLREPAAHKSTTKQVVLRFSCLEPLLSPDQSRVNSSLKSSYILPVSNSGNTLVARIDVKAGKVDYDSAQVDHVCDTRTANVVILQPALDLQVGISNRQSVDVTGDLSEALERVVRGLGILGHSNRHAPPHRHGVIETHLGRFGLEAAEVADVSRVQSSSDAMVRVRQTWDVIDDLRFSQVELLPTAMDEASSAPMSSEEEWEKYLLCLFKAALEQSSSSGLATTDSASSARGVSGL
ncbi:hypothetical protein IWW37_003761 [Coemansia sp. RSA 2050]|nr:hypothetical protein IWW37_003761 [Coemansia sp. RSA 2050]KAJ2732589.1 hypothetical protein IW152_003704 [Coemansia sp. BCRC 34962]